MRTLRILLICIFLSVQAVFARTAFGPERGTRGSEHIAYTRYTISVVFCVFCILNDRWEREELLVIGRRSGIMSMRYIRNGPKQQQEEKNE